MFKGHSILAIIPAKGKSSRLPGKNMKPFAGKPLIVWTIMESKQSRFLDAVIVSTDNKRIARISRRWGAKIPFKRPSSLVKVNITSIDVARHAAMWFKKKREHFDLIVLLQPTSPLRTVKDIDESIEYFFKKNADVLISVARTTKPPIWLKIINKDGYLEDMFKGGYKKKVQSESFYMPNGAIYVMKIEALFSSKNYKVIPYLMDNNCSVDIDEQLDFKIAQWLMWERLGEKNKERG